MALGLGPIDATRGVDTATALSGPEASLKEPPDVALLPGRKGLHTRRMLPDVRDVEGVFGGIGSATRDGGCHRLLPCY